MVYQLYLYNYLLPGESGTPVKKLLYDSRIDDLAVFDAKVTVEVNASGMMQFTVPMTHPCYDYIKVGRSWIDFKADIFYVLGGSVATITQDLFGNKIVTVYGASIALKDVYLPDIEFAGGSSSTLFEIINQQIREQTVGKYQLMLRSDIVEPLNFCYGTAWDLLKVIRDSYAKNNIYWNLFSDIVDFSMSGGSTIYLGNTAYSSRGTLGFTIKAGTNLVDYTEEIDESTIYSGIMPLGAETGGDFHGTPRRVQIVNPPDVGIVWDSTLVTKYGEKVVKRIYEDCTSAAQLNTRASAELLSLRNTKKRLRVRAIDIGRVTDLISSFRLMYSVLVEASPTIEAETFFIKKIEYDLNDPSQDVIDLTNYA